MLDNNTRFMAMKGRLFLEICGKDPTYTEELKAIVELSPKQPNYKEELKTMVMKLLRMEDESMRPDILEVVKQTECMSESFLNLWKKVDELDGKRTDAQFKGIREILEDKSLKKMEEEELRDIYSAILNLSINLNDTELITKMVERLEALS